MSWTGRQFAVPLPKNFLTRQVADDLTEASAGQWYYYGHIHVSESQAPDQNSFANTGDGHRFAAICVNRTCALADVNGDGLADFVSFEGSNGTPTSEDVWIALSDGQDFTCAVADVDGDGKADLLAFARTSTPAISAAFTTWVARSTGEASFSVGTNWGNDFCRDSYRNTALVGDVNGDGKGDAVCTAEANFYF